MQTNIYTLQKLLDLSGNLRLVLLDVRITIHKEILNSESKDFGTVELRFF